MNITEVIRKIRLYDPAAFSELESLRTTDIRAYEEVIWTLIANVDCRSCTDISPQLLAMLYASLGTAHVDKTVFAKWSTLSEAGRANICYAAAIPAALPTELAFCLFFSPFSTVYDRHMIAAGLAASAQERGIEKAVLWLLPQIGVYSSLAQQEVLQQFVSDATRSL